MHIFKKIIHPAHIPFEQEAKSAKLNRRSHTRPCGRFLRYDHGSRSLLFKFTVHMMKQMDRIIVFIATIFVWQPFSIIFSIIEIKHRSNGIHT